MKHSRFAWVASILAALTLSLPLTASADPALRVQMDLHGDFVLFGNTVAQECANSAPACRAMSSVAVCSAKARACRPMACCSARGVATSIRA